MFSEPLKINDFIYFPTNNLWPIFTWKLDEWRGCQQMAPGFLWGEWLGDDDQS